MSAPLGPVEAGVLEELAAGAGVRAEDVDVGAPGVPDGGHLRVLRGRRAERGEKLLVLLHGRGHAASVWFPLLPALAARGPVLAADLPGFGASQAGPAPRRRAGPEAGLAFFAAPIEALLERELRDTGASAIVLCGHSLGGLVALELALRGRLPVAGLALVNSMGLGPDMTAASRLFFRLHPERLARLLGRRAFERLNPPPPGPLGRRIADLEHELLTARPRATAAAAARAFDSLCPLFGPVFHRRARLAELAIPVLPLWGERDRALPATNALGAASPIRDGVVRFPGLGHSPHLEAPGAVLPLLGALL